jgi:hypothetical protein
MPLPTDQLRTTIVANFTSGEVAETNNLHDRINKLIAGWSHRGPVVAPSTTSAAIKETADFVCDGTADQSEITTAHATGRPVLMLPGTFNLSATIAPTTPVPLVGCGWSTILKVNDATNIYAITLNPATNFFGGLFADFKIECNGNNQTTAGGGIDAKGAVQCAFRHLWINKPHTNGLYLREDAVSGFGHGNVVEACLFDQGEQSNGGDGRALRFDSNDENLITGCAFTDNGRVGASERNHIYDLCGLNTVQGNSFVGGGTGLKMQGADSSCLGNTFDGCKDHHVRVNGDRCHITGNKFYHLGFTGTNIVGVWVDNIANTKVTDNMFDTISSGAAAGGTAKAAIDLSSGTPTNAIVQANHFLATGLAYATAAVVPGSGSGHLIRDNKGWVTEAKGTATVANGTTSVAVTHGLSVTPALSDIKVTPTNDPTTTVRWWVSAVSATTFTITTSGNPGASGATFAWQAQVL